METNQEAILKSIHDLETRVKKMEQYLKLSHGEVKEAVSISKQLSLRELMQGAEQPSNVEKVLLVGYYLEMHEGFKCFNADDVEIALQTAKERPLSNSLAFINQNIKNGNIMEVKEKKNNRKAYTLTATGEDIVTKILDNKES